MDLMLSCCHVHMILLCRIPPQDWEKITADPQKGLGNTFELLEEYGDKIKELQAIINERLIELKDVKSAKVCCV